MSSVDKWGGGGGGGSLGQWGGSREFAWRSLRAELHRRWLQLGLRLRRHLDGHRHNLFCHAQADLDAVAGGRLLLLLFLLLAGRRVLRSLPAGAGLLRGGAALLLRHTLHQKVRLGGLEGLDGGRHLRRGQRHGHLELAKCGNGVDRVLDLDNRRLVVLLAALLSLLAALALECKQLLLLALALLLHALHARLRRLHRAGGRCRRGCGYLLGQVALQVARHLVAQNDLVLKGLALLGVGALLALLLALLPLLLANSSPRLALLIELAPDVTLTLVVLVHGGLALAVELVLGGTGGLDDLVTLLALLLELV
mmetsp:Transcript_24085/g.62587  ORF Transcript_24085/g.62587 Transcript_24085/m.62587 type:complete len:310 (+) Transcript_24085:871-1800(+)